MRILLGRTPGEESPRVFRCSGGGCFWGGLWRIVQEGTLLLERVLPGRDSLGKDSSEEAIPGIILLGDSPREDSPVEDSSSPLGEDSVAENSSVEDSRGEDSSAEGSPWEESSGENSPGEDALMLCAG